MVEYKGYKIDIVGAAYVVVLPGKVNVKFSSLASCKRFIDTLEDK